MNVEDFYAELGVSLSRGTGTESDVRCFANPDAHSHGDRNRSCRVSRSSGAWYCHGCGAKGGAYDAALALGKEPREAMQTLRRHGLVEDGEASPRRPSSSVTAEDRRALARYAESRNADLGSDSDSAQQALAYLSDRFGIDQATALNLGLGVDSGSSAVDRPEFLSTFVGVPRLVIPFRDAHGKVRGCQGRALPEDAGLRWTAPSGSGWAKWGAFCLDRTEPVVVCEGPTDALAAVAAGLAAVAIRGASLTAGDDLLDTLRGRTVVVAGDGDDAGQRFATSVVESARAAGVESAVLTLSAGQDLSDTLSGEGPEALRGRIEECAERAEASTSRVSRGSRGSQAVESEWERLASIDPVASLPPFPVDSLPPWQAQFVDAVAESTQTPDDMAGMLVLAATSTAVAGRLLVEPLPGKTEVTNLYVAVAMEPGERKSPVFSLISKPLFDFEREELERMRPLIVEAESRRKIAEDRSKEAHKRAAHPNVDEPEVAVAEAVEAARLLDEIAVPALPQLLADDTTPEAVSKLLHEQGGRLAIMSDEGGIFELMGRYGATRVPNLDVYLKSHSGGRHRVNRAGGKHLIVDRPALTLGLAVQPDVVESLAEQRAFRGRGLLGRFIYSIPTSYVGRRKVGTPAVPGEIEARYNGHLRRIVETFWPMDEPYTLTLDPAARDVQLAWETELEPQLAPFDELCEVRDWATKLGWATTRIAALIHVASRIEGNWQTPVTAEEMRAAVNIGRYLIPHALTAFDLLGEGKNDSVHVARKVVRWIEARRHSEFKHQDCWQAVKGGRVQTVDDLDPALDFLTELHYIRPIEPESGGRGRKPRPTYVVNPQLHGGATPNTPEMSGRGVSRGYRGSGATQSDSQDACFHCTKEAAGVARDGTPLCALHRSEYVVEPDENEEGGDVAWERIIV